MTNGNGVGNGGEGNRQTELAVREEQGLQAKKHTFDKSLKFEYYKLVTTDEVAVAGDDKGKAGERWYVQFEGEKGHVVVPTEPFCDCQNFNINRRKRSLCKHLKALMLVDIPVSQPLSGALIQPLTIKTIGDLVKAIVDPNLIVQYAEDGYGQGILYEYDEKVGYFVKEDLVAMLARRYNIVSKPVKLTYDHLPHKGNEITILTVTAEAIHIPTGYSLERSASVVFDFRRIEAEQTNKREGRTFASRTAESEACRRAELVLMGIPERIIVPMIKSVLEPYKRNMGIKKR